MSIKERTVWTTCCDTCGEPLGHFANYTSQKEAKERLTIKGYQGSNDIYRAYVCVFCQEVVCSKCQANTQVNGYPIPVCKRCASQREISELVTVATERDKGHAPIARVL